jgi:hypothetical protein
VGIAVGSGAASTASASANGSETGGAGAATGAAGGAALIDASPVRTGDGRDCRPRRCALPITALRLTPPSSSAIWLAVWPASQSFLSCSMRSSVHAMRHVLLAGGAGQG